MCSSRHSLTGLQGFMANLCNITVSGIFRNQCAHSEKNAHFRDEIPIYEGSHPIEQKTVVPEHKFQRNLYLHLNMSRDSGLALQMFLSGNHDLLPLWQPSVGCAPCSEAVLVSV